MFNEEWKSVFLRKSGWDNAEQSRVGEDWSLRRFCRLKKHGQTAILLQSVPDDDPSAMRGHKLGDYVTISTYLQNLGFNVPEIYAQDLEHGLLLIEDFGDVSLHDLFEANSPELKSYYLKATDILIGLYRKTPANDLHLAKYYDGHIHFARRFLIDYYMPYITGKSADDKIRKEYMDIWDDIEKSLPEIPLRFSHCDFHPHNLMINKGQIGLIDFQGAYWGPIAYDLVNLLEDARRMVPDDIKQACKERYLAVLPAAERDAFDKWYVVLAAQFHCRVVGQAIKLADEGKARLMDYVPILQKHLIEDLKSPLLAPLARFFKDNGIVFTGRAV